MALGHTPTNAQLRRRFQRGLQILLDTFHDAILLSTQDIQVVNFSNISRGFVNVIQGYKYRYPGGVSTKVPFAPTKLEEGEEAPATSETATTSDPTTT